MDLAPDLPDLANLLPDLEHCGQTDPSATSATTSLGSAPSIAPPRTLTNASSTAQSVAVAQPYRLHSYTTGIPVLHSELLASQYS